MGGNLELPLEQSCEVPHEPEAYLQRFKAVQIWWWGEGRSSAHFMVIDLLEIHHHGKRNLGKEF